MKQNDNLLKLHDHYWKYRMKRTHLLVIIRRMLYNLRLKVYDHSFYKYERNLQIRAKFKWESFPNEHWDQVLIRGRIRGSRTDCVFDTCLISVRLGWDYIFRWMVKPRTRYGRIVYRQTIVQLTDRMPRIVYLLFWYSIVILYEKSQFPRTIYFKKIVFFSPIIVYFQSRSYTFG